MYREGGGLLLSLGQFVFDLLTVKCNDEDPKTPKFSLKSFFLPTFGSNKQKFWLFFTLKLENFDQNTKILPKNKNNEQKDQNSDKNLTLFKQKKT